MHISDFQPNLQGGVPKATRREWIGLAVLSLPCILASMDLTVLNLAVPHLSADLQPSPSQLLWIMDIYGFFIAGSLITMGTLGDRIGRRKVLLMGAVAFGVASALAAFATTATQLIVMRALLGVAGATLAPSTLSDPQYVSRSTGANPGHWDLGHVFLPRRHDGAGVGRHSAGTFSLGIGLSAECADHASPAGIGSLVAAGI